MSTLRFLANCSLMFTELPLLQRPAAARAAGFEAIEFWWPFAGPEPQDREADAFAAAIEDAGVRLIGLNLYAGDLFGPDCGALSVPVLSADFRRSLPTAAALGARLGVRGMNALYGNRIEGIAPQEQDVLAMAASALKPFGARLLIEPVSGPKPYPLRTADQAVTVVQRARAAGLTNIGLLYDLYHLVTNGDDPHRALHTHAPNIAHIQIADAPGRGEPGTGSIDFEAFFTALDRIGYDGWVGLEYRPSTATADTLGWLNELKEERANT